MKMIAKNQDNPEIPLHSFSTFHLPCLHTGKYWYFTSEDFYTPKVLFFVLFCFCSRPNILNGILQKTRGLVPKSSHREECHRWDKALITLGFLHRITESEIIESDYYLGIIPST